MSESKMAFKLKGQGDVLPDICHSDAGKANLGYVGHTITQDSCISSLQRHIGP